MNSRTQNLKEKTLSYNEIPQPFKEDTKKYLSKIKETELKDINS